MDRVVRLYQLWSWLPHFRAIAETEHLPSASEALGLSPSALSRALKQLEASVGHDLFIREGRTIRLNDAGQELLRAVRLAMRTIDDSLNAFQESEMPVVLRLAAPGPYFGALILGVVRNLRAENSQLRFEFSSCATDLVISRLCQGKIDLCLHEEALDNPELMTTELARVPKVVSCAPSHALAKRKSLAVEDLMSYEFAAPPLNAHGIREDGWPAGNPRTVSLVVSQMQMGIDACLQGDYLVILPRFIAQAHGLVELSIEGVAPLTASVFVSTRKPCAEPRAEIDGLLRGLGESLRQTQ